MSAETRSSSSRTAFGALRRFIRHQDSSFAICWLASGLTTTRRGSLTPDAEAPRERFRWELLLHVHIERSIRGAFAQFLDLPRTSPPPEAARLPKRLPEV